MNRREIVNALLKMDVDEARATLKEAYAALERKARNAVDIGQKVRFRSKYGPMIEGVVTRVNRKNIIVMASMDRHGLKTPRPVQWTVSPSLLTPVEDDGSAKA